MRFIKSYSLNKRYSVKTYMINKIALLNNEYPKIIIESSVVVFVALLLGGRDLLIAFLISTLLYLHARSSKMSYVMVGVFSVVLFFFMLFYLNITDGLEDFLLFRLDEIIKNKKILTIYVSLFLFIQSFFGYLIHRIRNSD